MQNLQIGATLQDGKYVIKRVLGQGGFGITYLAKHTLLDKQVAIKEFYPKNFCDRIEGTREITLGNSNTKEIVVKLKDKFIKEAKNISKLCHPNIVAIHDIFEENGTAYYLMDYINGISLYEVIKKKGTIPVNDSLRYINIIGHALGYMHDKKMNHLDIKPANIMLRETDDTPVLIDFGLSKQYDSVGEQTSSTPVGISNGFAPIEQYRPGGVSIFTPQTDVYALGATLYNMVTGKTPPHYSEILEFGLPILPDSISKSVTDAIVHAMSVRKNERPDSVEEFLAELSMGVFSKINSNIMTTSSYNTPIDSNENGMIHNRLQFDKTMLIKQNEPMACASSTGKVVVVDGMEFIDLGLSVKWANKNVDAERIDNSGSFIDKSKDENISVISRWNNDGAKVPNVRHFEELIAKCTWVWSETEDVYGYSIVGPNGNSIFLPVTGEGIKFPNMAVSYGLLWSYDAFYTDNRDNAIFLYFNANQHSLVKYNTSKVCPVRLVI